MGDEAYRGATNLFVIGSIEKGKTAVLRTVLDGGPLKDHELVYSPMMLGEK